MSGTLYVLVLENRTGKYCVWRSAQRIGTGPSVPHIVSVPLFLRPEHSAHCASPPLLSRHPSVRHKPMRLTQGACPSVLLIVPVPLFPAFTQVDSPETGARHRTAQASDHPKHRAWHSIANHTTNLFRSLPLQPRAARAPKYRACPLIRVEISCLAPYTSWCWKTALANTVFGARPSGSVPAQAFRTLCLSLYFSDLSIPHIVPLHPCCPVIHPSDTNPCA